MMTAISFLALLVMAAAAGGSPVTPETINPVIGAIIFLAIITAIVLVAKGGMTKKAGVVGGWLANLFTSAGGNKFWLVATAVGGYLLILAGVTYLWPAFWEWLRSQNLLFWWIVLVLPVLVAAAAKFKFLWWLVIIGIIIALAATDWETIPNIADWRLPTLEDANSAAVQRKAERVASAVEPSAANSRVTTRTIIARPDEFSEMIYIPPGSWFRWHADTDGCIIVKNGRGQERQVCGKEHVYRSENLPLLDGMMAFKYPDGEVEVTVEWESK